MIDIRIEGESLETKQGLILEYFNPMFDFTTVPGSRVYSFNVPDTARNRQVLGYFSRIEIPYQNKKYYCEKLFFGQIIERGYVKIQEVSTNSISLYFTQNLNEVFGSFQTKLLTEIDFGSEPLPTNPNPNPVLATAKYALPSIENDYFYGNQNIAGFANIVNQYSGAYNATARVPMFFLKYIFQIFGNLNDFNFTGSFFQNASMQRLLLYNLYSLDGASNFLYQNHLPEITMRDLIMELRRLFNLYLHFNIQERKLNIDFVEDIIKSETVLDWTLKADVNYTKVPDQNSRLELSYEIDTNDQLQKPTPPDFDKYVTPETTINDGGVTPIRSRFSTLLTNSASGLAQTKQVGVSPENKDNQNKTTPKLLFWHGLVAGVPTATNQHSSTRLAWHGADNLVQNFYSETEAWKARTFLIRKRIYLSVLDLSTLDLRKKVHISGVDYFISSLKANLEQNKRVITCDVELWRV